MDHARIYQVRLPDGYESARAYPLIFRFHGHGGDGSSGGLDIERVAADSAIVVGPDGLYEAWSTRSEANDLAFFDAMYAALAESFCVDLTRVFAYGFSMGGGMSNLLGCKRASKLRGIAVIAGFNRGAAPCDGPSAAWLRHDRSDDMVTITEGQRARDSLRARNHCSEKSAPFAQDCVHYADCDPGYPVVWCETDGRGHDIAAELAPQQVWQFFRSLP